MAIVDNLVQQFGVRGERDVLLLYGRVYEGCLLLVALASTTVLSVLPVILLLLPVLDGEIDADALLQDKLYAHLAYTVTKMNKFRGCTRSSNAKGFHSAEVLIIGILCKLCHNLFVRYIAQMFEHKQTHHQTDGLGRTSVVSTE